MPSGILYTPDALASAYNKIWIRFGINTRVAPVFKIWEENIFGDDLKRTITCGTLEPGRYVSRSNSVFWDCTDEVSARVDDGDFHVELLVGGEIVDTIGFAVKSEA